MPRSKKQSKHVIRWTQYGVIAVSIALIIFGAIGVWQAYQVTHNPNPIIPIDTVVVSTDEPDETDLRDICDRYAVAADQPRKIHISSLGISHCIQKVGIDQNGAIAVPSNVHLAGWFVDSPVPGENGVSIIDGHLRGRYREGIFAGLHTVKIGESIAVEMGDGSLRQFEVVTNESYPVDQTAVELFENLPGVERQLTLITCGGEYDERAKTYDERVVVKAVLKTDAIF